ncbi:MAG: hypothetical protein ACR2GC_09280 [Methyloceanibacter sp.]|uniref:hypothetical protein n=1 Tax=Methyloceanibacter sp. TaxID=1965321 RepID=UPI003D9B511C
MSRLTQILIGSGVVLALLVILVVLAGNWGSSAPSQTVEMSFGTHLVTVKGHYKDLTQETIAEGLLIAVDGNEITVNDAQVTAAGLTHVLEPGQNIEILVDEKGTVKVKVAEPDAGGDAAATDAAPE